MADKVQNKIIVLEPSTKSATDLLALLQEKNSAELITVNTPEEAIAKIIDSLPCLFVSSLIDNNAVPARVQMLKRLETSIKQHGLKVFMVTGIKNRQLADLFTQKMGVTDYIVDPVPARTMMFKLNLALKAIDNFRKQEEIKQAAQKQIVIKKLDSKKIETAAEVAAKGKPALQLAEDTFLFKNGAAKKSGKKFILEVEGPDPSTGEWQQHADKGDAKSAWRWVPNEEKEAQANGNAPTDGWVHEGEKPAFNEETGKWALTSEAPVLALKKAGQTVAEKISLDEKGALVIAEDSPAAADNLQKNRIKAADAIKQREEKQKILTEKKKALDKAAIDQSKGEALVETSEEGLLAVKEGSGGAQENHLKGKPKIEKSAALEKMVNFVDRDEASEFNDQLDGKKEQLRSVIDKRDNRHLNAPTPQPKEPPNSQAVPFGEAKKSSPLDFLKKKKEQLQEAALANGVNTIKTDPASKGVNALKDSEEEIGPSAGILNRKKSSKKASAAADRLARLKAELEEDENEDVAEALSNDEESSEEDGAEISAIAGTAAEKNRGTPQLKLNDGEKPAERGSPKLKLKKKKALEAIQKKLLAPLPEEMAPEEEQELRKELGLENSPEIKVKELARKKRLNEVKRMQDLLSEIDEEIAQEEGEVISGGYSSKIASSRERGQTGDTEAEKLKGIRGAIDNENPEDSEEEENIRRKRDASDSKEKNSGLEDKALYMPEAELLPKGNAWDSAGSYFVYLNAQIRYKGFNSLDEVLPLWIFKGEAVPELLDKSKQWRFRGSLPMQATTLSDIPADVRDFLLSIRDQLKANNALEGEEVAETGQQESKKDKKKSSTSSALDRLRAELADDAANIEDESAENSVEASTEEKEDLIAKQSKFKQGGELSLPGEELNGLKARKSRSRQDAAESVSEESSASEENPQEAKGATKTASKKSKKSAGAAGLDALARLREKMGALETTESEEASHEEAKSEQAAEPEIEKIREQKNAAAAKERLAKLRTQLEMAEELEEDSEISSKKKEHAQESEASASEFEDLEAAQELKKEFGKNGKRKPSAPSNQQDSMQRLREKLAASESATEENSQNAHSAHAENENASQKNSNAEEDSSLLGSIAKAEASDAVKKFMDRRKNKAKKNATPRSPPIGDASLTAATVYLGIYVSLSDVLAQEKEISVALPRVLKAFEESFGDCIALCTGLPDSENFSLVRFSAPSPSEAITRVQPSSGIFEPITTGDGSDTLGYLLLQPAGARSVFSEAEHSTIKKIALNLWPILKRDSMDSGRNAA